MPVQNVSSLFVIRQPPREIKSQYTGGHKRCCKEYRVANKINETWKLSEYKDNLGSHFGHMVYFQAHCLQWWCCLSRSIAETLRPSITSISLSWENSVISFGPLILWTQKKWNRLRIRFTKEFFAILFRYKHSLFNVKLT